MRTWASLFTKVWNISSGDWLWSGGGSDGFCGGPRGQMSLRQTSRSCAGWRKVRSFPCWSLSSGTISPGKSRTAICLLGEMAVFRMCVGGRNLEGGAPNSRNGSVENLAGSTGHAGSWRGKSQCPRCPAYHLASPAFVCTVLVVHFLSGAQYALRPSNSAALIR